MSPNKALRKKTAAALEDGGIFAFGLSEKTHGADIYSTDMVLTKNGDGWLANGRKYYIGNGNEAAIVVGTIATATVVRSRSGRSGRC